jgi:hypothetical protein
MRARIRARGVIVSRGGVAIVLIGRNRPEVAIGSTRVEGSRLETAIAAPAGIAIRAAPATLRAQIVAEGTAVEVETELEIGVSPAVVGDLGTPAHLAEAGGPVAAAHAVAAHAVLPAWADREAPEAAVAVDAVGNPLRLSQRRHL